MAVATLERPAPAKAPEEEPQEAPAPSEAAPVRMTYAQFLDWLDEDTHAEWVDGEVMMHSPVSLRHQDVRGLLYSLLRIFVDARQAGRLADDPFQMKIGADFPGRAPDILFVATEHLDRLKPNFLEGPADLVVEIISPDSRGRDRGEKHLEYERGGVREYWLIDPERRQAEFYLPDANGVYHVHEADPDGIFRSRVLEGLWIRPEWLWQEPMPAVLGIVREWGLLAEPAGAA